MKESSVWPFAALVAVLVAGFVFLLIGLFIAPPVHPESPPPGSAPSQLSDIDDVSSLIGGDFTAALDRRIETGHPWRPIAVPAISLVRYILFRDLPEIVVGREGVLFTEEEVAVSAVDQEVLRERTRSIIDRAGAIKARGATPVVLLLPTKARTYEEYLPQRFREQAHHIRYDQALSDLGAAGIVVIDARGALEALPPGEGFFRRDTHWTPLGAAAVAEAVAAAVADAIDGKAAPEATRRSADLSRTVYESLPGEPTIVPGDLMNFLPIGGFRDALGLPVERSTQPRYRRETAALGLFDSITIPLLLTGTSYSADERWAFDLQLGAILSLDVLNLASAGEGPFTPMDRLLEEERIEEYGASIVVWEIPERYLTIDLP